MVNLDGWIGFAPTLLEAVAASEAVKRGIVRSGFIPNVQKSVWIPAETIEWFGF